MCFVDPVIPWRVALQHGSLLLHRMLDFIISVSDGQPTYRHRHVHNLFKTVFCPIFSDHPSLSPIFCYNGEQMLVKLNTFSLLGIDAVPVEVEVDCADIGMPAVMLL